MVIFFFVVISVLYGIFLLRSNFKFISLLFIAVYSVSFLLPIVVNKPFNFQMYLDKSAYDYTNSLYLLALVTFVISNTTVQLIKFDFEFNKITVLRKQKINNIYLIYIIATLIVLLLTGPSIITSGSNTTLDSGSVIKMLQGSALIGYLYLSYLYLYNAQKMQDKIKALCWY